MALHGAPQLELDSKHLTPDIRAGFHAVIAKHPAGLTAAGMATRLTACAVMANTCCLELRAAHNMIDRGFAEEPLVSQPYYTCVKQDDMLHKMMETMVEALEVCHMSHMLNFAHLQIPMLVMLIMAYIAGVSCRTVTSIHQVYMSIDLVSDALTAFLRFAREPLMSHPTLYCCLLSAEHSFAIALSGAAAMARGASPGDWQCS